jgi:putrescine aminotransferase
VNADPELARRCLRQARTHLAPGIALGQKITGGGAVEVSASGAVVTLSNGRQLLDFGSYAVTLLGHLHPEVVASVQRQLGLISTSTRVLANPVTSALATRIVKLLQPSRLRRVWFGQNGTDAVEAALKLARLRTGRTRILAVSGGYHGKSLGSLAATWSPRYRRGLESVLAPVTHISPTDPDAVAAEVQHGDVAALIFEPVQGEGGVVPLRPGIVARWAADARSAGAFLIADEIQTGLWRAGAVSLALDPEFAVDPDAVLLGKPLGGGVLPLSAAVCSEELYAPLAAEPFLHATTFSGHPLACAAGLAGIGALEKVAHLAQRVGTRLREKLFQLAGTYPDLITDVRGRGLLWGLEMSSSAVAGTVLTELFDGGLLVSPCLGRPEVLRLLPPIIATDAQLDAAAAILEGALHAARAYAGNDNGAVSTEPTPIRSLTPRGI